MRYEVETKVKIKNVKELKEKVKKIARFNKREIKVDDYYAIKRNGYPKKAFRIRSVGKSHIVNFKKWAKKYWDKRIVVKEEYEFEIKDVEDFLTLMKDLGFFEWIRKIKISEHYIYRKDKKLSIEINKVEKLGYFMEIEYLTDKRGIEKAKKRIREILEELEVSEKDINNTVYAKMLWEKKR